MRLLLAEDDRQLRETIARGLREATYAVDETADGESTVKLATARDYDALVLDVLMPNVDGLEACRELRRRGNRLPILMLTALDSVEDKIAGLDAGADDYLAKPFAFGELLARLRALTRRHGEIASESLTVGDLVIDLAQRSVRRGERAIALTAKEFAFLAYLARHAGRVVSRAEILAHVWEDAHAPYSNLIDVYASRIRRKVDDGESAPLFTTHRAIGYMLAAPAAPRASRPRRDTSGDGGGGSATERTSDKTTGRRR